MPRAQPVLHSTPLRGASVRIGAEVVLGRLGPEESFGEFCVLGDMPYLATGRAVTEVELLSVHRSDFEKMYQNVPSMRKRIDAQVSQRKKLIR